MYLVEYSRTRTANPRSFAFPDLLRNYPPIAEGLTKMGTTEFELDFAKQDGFVPVIVQDAGDGTVLMLAYMNEVAFHRTIETGRATYWSRSRNELWVKGESSGNVQDVEEVLVDCDDDTVLLKVRQRGGAACHEGYRSCFFRRTDDGKLRVIAERVFDPKDVYRE
jgi:phosphoribosyl-AMP cyclohydrolase